MKDPETIDLTPTWEGTMRFYIGVLESTQAEAEARNIIRADLMKLARWVDSRLEQDKEVQP